MQNAGGQKKLDERNSQILADGLTPRKTIFQTQKEFLRTAIEEAADSSCSLEEFQKLLLEKYSIKLKTSRGRFSYLHPERSKYITERMLGTHYETDYLLKLFEENAIKRENKKRLNVPEEYDTAVKPSVNRDSTPEQEEPIAILFVRSDLQENF